MLFIVGNFVFKGFILFYRVWGNIGFIRQGSINIVLYCRKKPVRGCFLFHSMEGIDSFL